MNENINIWFSKVNDAVKMRDVISMYTNKRTGARSGRIPCPLHGGKDNNFAYNDAVYHCWTCGAKGNTISFVAEMFGLDRMDALRKIDHDFNLNVVGERYTQADTKKENERLEQIRKEQKERDKLNKLYRDKCDELHFVTSAIKSYAREGDFDKVAELMTKKHELDYLTTTLLEAITNE